MARTSLPNLTQEEWNSVKDLSATLTGYDQKSSSIRGKKTLEILQAIDLHMDSGEWTAAQTLTQELIKREAFNTMCGVEGKSRRKAKLRASSAS